MSEESAPVPVKPAKPNTEPAEGVVYTLKRPVTLGPLHVAELRFPERLKGRHVRRWSVGERGIVDADVLLRVASDACGVPDRVFDEMDAEDTSALLELMTGFFVKAGFLRGTPAS